jgi:hypothetical protein
MRLLFGLCCAVVAVRAGADTVGDLKSAVGRLAAKQPVRATYATQSAVKTAGHLGNVNTARTVSIEVAHDAGGISLTIPQPLLDKAAAEARTEKGAAENVSRGAISSIRPQEVVEALDFRETFLWLLSHGTVAEEKRVAFRGKPARLLVLTLHVPERKMNGIQLGTVKIEEDRLSVWIGDDNLPLAAERAQKNTAGFLLFHATRSARTSYTFAHTADRLVLARMETSGSGSGMGQTFDDSGVQTMTLH